MHTLIINFILANLGYGSDWLKRVHKILQVFMENIKAKLGVECRTPTDKSADA